MELQADTFGHFQISFRGENSRDEANVRFYNMRPHEKIIVNIKEGEEILRPCQIDERDADDTWC